MNVSLTPQLERMINQKVKTGMDQTASEVVREGLRLMQERDKAKTRLHADVQLGLDQLDNGRYSELDSLPTLVARIKAQGRRRLVGTRNHA